MILHFKAKSTDLTLDQINTWFTNTRRKNRRDSEKKKRDELIAFENAVKKQNSTPNYLVLNQKTQIVSYALPKISVVRPLYTQPIQHLRKLNVDPKQEESSKALLVENLGAD
jgi:hypothetical protein